MINTHFKRFQQEAAAYAMNYQKVHTRHIKLMQSNSLCPSQFYCGGDTSNDDLCMTICVSFSGHWRVREGDPNHQHQTLIKAM